MKTQKGTTRRVFIFKHVVIKIALIRWATIFKIFEQEFVFIKKHGLDYFSLKNKKREDFARIICFEDKEKFGIKVVTLKRHEVDSNMILYYLLLGILPNIQERRFYKKTKNPFVMPTYFSFFGLVNIQKRGKQIYFWGDNDVFRYLCQNSQNRNQPHVDGHTLSEIENFVLDNDNHMKLVDYGNKQVAPFLEMNGENLYNNFKLPE